MKWINVKDRLPVKKNKEVYLKVDGRNRVALSKLEQPLAPLYKAYMDEDRIVLDPIKEIPKNELWLFDSKNKEILNMLRESLKQKPAASWDDIKHVFKDFEKDIEE